MPDLIMEERQPARGTPRLKPTKTKEAWEAQEGPQDATPKCNAGCRLGS